MIKRRDLNKWHWYRGVEKTANARVDLAPSITFRLDGKWVVRLFAGGLVCAGLVLGPGCVSHKHRAARPNAKPAIRLATAPASAGAERRTPARPARADVPADPLPAAAPEWATLRPGLVVNITVVVAGKKQIDESGRRVSENGSLTLPLLGALAVDGETLDAFTARLTDRYREFFVDPQVIVEFVRNDQTAGISPWGYVTVLGRVKRPGRVDIPPTRDLTVSLAIQQAGGFDTSAKETAIAVTRRLADGRNETRQIDLREIGKRGSVDQDIFLLPDDVVYVPELIF